MRTQDATWWETLLAACLVFGTLALFHKGCSALSGVDAERDFQQQQFDSMPIPNNTTCELPDPSGPDALSAWIKQWCTTSLPESEIITFYTTVFEQRGWLLNTHLKQSPVLNHQLIDLNWDKNGHQFTLAIASRKQNKKDYRYMLLIRWGQSLKSRL